jgi:hypothetical protein
VHEKLQLLVQQAPVTQSVHHLTLLHELKGSSPFSAEAGPGHHLGGMLDCLLCEFLLEPVRAHWPSAERALVSTSQLKVALVTEHDFFSLVILPQWPYWWANSSL